MADQGVAWLLACSLHAVFPLCDDSELEMIATS